MKIMKSIKVRLEKDFKTPFNYTFKADTYAYQATIDGNGTVHVSVNDGDFLLTACFVKGSNIIIL
jgi:formylmethanofuran:tetrahydromethanopterin formyltransferase